MKQEIAIQFGRSLDGDEFEKTAQLIHSDCRYVIGEVVLIGPEKICGSYEENMIAGRKKLDVLEWGKSRIEAISESQFFVHFTDYLEHQGKKYTHRCKQKLTINSENLIVEIIHIDDREEQERLNSYYRGVGL